MNTKVLMCSPDFYRVAYEINPWMVSTPVVDVARAKTEWHELVNAYREHGIDVATIDPDPNLPDMVYTANAGLVFEDIFIPSKFHHTERQPESALAKTWFQNHGYKVHELKRAKSFEGEGDALFAGNTLYVGYGFRSTKDAAEEIAQLLPGIEVVRLGLCNPYFYHLDTCFAPLPNGSFVYYPDAFDDTTRIDLEKRGGHWVTEDNCVHYGCNALAVGDTLFTSHADWQLEDICKKENLKIKTLDISEFIKSGGGVKCLTLKI